VDLDLRPGGRISFVFRQNEGPALDGVITELDPPRVIAYSWGQDLLRWEVRPDGDGSLLVLVHTFDDHAGAASYAAGWNGHLGGPHRAARQDARGAAGLIPLGRPDATAPAARADVRSNRRTGA
jgi:uncharacterized protein YndB with AHSA1/START domain